MSTTARLSILSLAATVAIGLAALPARADERPPADAVAPAYVVHMLVADGYDVRKLEFEDGRYVADIIAEDGRMVRVGLDPADGRRLPHAFAGRAPRPDPAPAGADNASIAVQLVATAGYPDLVELEFEDGAYRLKARDAGGRPVTLVVDPVGMEIVRTQQASR